jgi:hypothetical protein
MSEVNGFNGRAPVTAFAPLRPEHSGGPTLSAAQVYGRSALRQERDAAVGAKFTDGGSFIAPTMAFDLLAEPGVPMPLLRAYLIGCRRASRKDGRYRISFDALAEKLSSKTDQGQGRRRHAERVQRRLMAAGLVIQETRGGVESGQANSYRLLSLDGVDLERVREILRRPLTSRAAGTAAVAGVGAGNTTAAVANGGRT